MILHCERGYDHIYDISTITTKDLDEQALHAKR